MTILVAEKNKHTLNALTDMLKHQSDATILSFPDSPSALAAARSQEIDTAFLDVALPEIDGLLLGRYLKDLNPNINLIMMTTKRADAFDAMNLRASGCILLPPEEKDVLGEMRELRFPTAAAKQKRVFIQTFGNFEIFADGVPIAFKYSRTKEILAILVNNKGVQTSNGEIIATLWEDDGDPKVKTSYLSNLRQDLQNTLSDLKLKDIIIKQRGSMAIASDKVECDLFEWLKHRSKSRYLYLGDYMNQYSWSEFVHSELDELSYAEDEAN